MDAIATSVSNSDHQQKLRVMPPSCGATKNRSRPRLHRRRCYLRHRSRRLQNPCSLNSSLISTSPSWLLRRRELTLAPWPKVSLIVHWRALLERRLVLTRFVFAFIQKSRRSSKGSCQDCRAPHPLAGHAPHHHRQARLQCQLKTHMPPARHRSALRPRCPLACSSRPSSARLLAPPLLSLPPPPPPPLPQPPPPSLLPPPLARPPPRRLRRGSAWTTLPLKRLRVTLSIMSTSRPLCRPSRSPCPSLRRLGLLPPLLRWDKQRQVHGFQARRLGRCHPNSNWIIETLPHPRRRPLLSSPELPPMLPRTGRSAEEWQTVRNPGAEESRPWSADDPHRDSAEPNQNTYLNRLSQRRDQVV